MAGDDDAIKKGLIDKDHKAEKGAAAMLAEVDDADWAKIFKIVLVEAKERDKDLYRALNTKIKVDGIRQLVAVDDARREKFLEDLTDELDEVDPQLLAGIVKYALWKRNVKPFHWKSVEAIS